MSDQTKEKSESRSVSLYPAEWEFVEQMIARHRYPDRSAFFRATLQKAYPNMFSPEHHISIPDGTADVESRLAQLEARARRFELILQQMKLSDQQIAKAMQVAEEKTEYDKKP